jgi:hypothetical protein
MGHRTKQDPTRSNSLVSDSIKPGDDGEEREIGKRTAIFALVDSLENAAQILATIAP